MTRVNTAVYGPMYRPLTYKRGRPSSSVLRPLSRRRSGPVFQPDSIPACLSLLNARCYTCLLRQPFERLSAARFVKWLNGHYECPLESSIVFVVVELLGPNQRHACKFVYLRTTWNTSRPAQFDVRREQKLSRYGGRMRTYKPHVSNLKSSTHCLVQPTTHALLLRVLP